MYLGNSEKITVLRRPTADSKHYALRRRHMPHAARRHQWPSPNLKKGKKRERGNGGKGKWRGKGGGGRGEMGEEEVELALARD